MRRGIVHEQNIEQQQIEKHMRRGCMSGFFNIFDRNHARLYPKRLPVVESVSGSASSSTGSPAISRPKPQELLLLPEPAPGIWKFRRETARLSLDSQLHPRGIKTTASEDEQRRSPSVVARLMGLGHSPVDRSASQSRSTDLLHCRFRDHPDLSCDTNTRNIITPQQLRKALYDFFPEPSPDAIEKRLKMTGIHEPLKDLHTLKQILQPLQLKGLLHHSKPPTPPDSRPNFVYDHRFTYDQSPIVVMRPLSNSTDPRTAPIRNSTPTSPGRALMRRKPEPQRRVKETEPRQRVKETEPRQRVKETEPRRIKETKHRQRVKETEHRQRVKETEHRQRVKETEHRRVKETEPRRVSPVGSPRTAKQRMDERAPRRQRSIRSGRCEDESWTVSESSFSTSSHTDTERSDCYKEGKSLLERCDKLLHSIAEMTSATSNTSTELQPSPVSVLDSSFYKEESSPSPLIKRTIHFKDLEDELWSPSSHSKSSDTELDNTDDREQDPDLTYVADIIRASNHVQNDSDIFLFLEKQGSRKGRHGSTSTRLQRRLIFDTISEILDQNRKLSPWKSASPGSNLREVWSVLQRIQKRDESEDLFEVICGVMKRDLTRDSINAWGECQLENSEAVLNIERMIFKDLIGETIRDLATFSGKTEPRRKLVF